MTDAMGRLHEKIDHQNKTAANLKERFETAMDIAVKDGGFCLDELQSFGQKVLREILGDMRRKEAHFQGLRDAKGEPARIEQTVS